MKRFGRRTRKTGLTRAALTPMVDIFTLLLVVLLASFSTDTPLRFTLAETHSDLPVPTASAVDLTPDGIYLDETRLTSSSFYVSESEALVEELYWPLLRMEKGPLLIRADAEMPYLLIQKLIFTAQEAGWQELSLVAESKQSL